MNCLHCGHEWVNRVDKPRRCPHCQAINYNQPKKFTIVQGKPINNIAPGERKW